MLANDRLKFRAWCRSTQQMIAWSEIKERLYALEWDEAMSDLALMQFAGMRDSRGVAIFEGDIIADCEDPCIGYWVVVWSPVTLAFMLGDLTHDPRDENYFKFSNIDDYLEDNISSYDIVVGNIFENEELFNVNLE